MTIQEKLKKHNLELPNCSAPGGNYVSVNVRGKIGYVAIQFPIINDKFYLQGKLGKEITTTEGYEAMKKCALNAIAQIHEKVGFNNIIGINHIDGYYCAEDTWDESPKVMDGASDLFIAILEEKGVHTRSILGVHNLPRKFCVGLTVSFTMK